MVILAYRNGIGWGLGSGLVYAAIQQLLGLNDLSYVTGWQSILAVIMLDYIVAFTVVGLGGIFRKAAKSQRNALVFGAVLVSLLRYVCHVISGATVWAGLSIPDKAALIYSIGYNATYMLPEAIILASVAYYLGGAIDFSRQTPTRVAGSNLSEGGSSIYLASGAAYLLGCIIDIWLIAPCLQDEETGKFIFSGLKNVSWTAVAIVTVLMTAIGTALLIAAKKTKSRTK